MERTIWSVGHSTRSIEDLIGLLKSYGIETLVDVRTIPRSRTNPQFNKDQMEQVLPDHGIEYIHAKDLGGLRRPLKDSTNTGWHNEGFRGYADYMQTPEFEKALEWLEELADRKHTAIMCAEAVPWRCHRSLLGDALTLHGFDVVEILSIDKSQHHKLTSFAKVQDGKLSYPAPPETQLSLER